MKNRDDEPRWPILEGRRLVNSLRISVNRECDLACFFCHGEGMPKEARLMTPEEIENITRIASGLGMAKVKLTGGEPLLRPDIVNIVSKISPWANEVSMTTNAISLPDLAEPLSEAGLKRVNISLHTVRPETYRSICGQDSLDKALLGLEAAKAAGLVPIKINMVLLRGLNDLELPEMLEFASQHGVILQLIELETVKERISKRIYKDHHKDMKEVKDWLLGTGTPIGNNPLHRREKIRMNRLPDGKRLSPPVEVELVMPMHNTVFCSNCTRIRLTAGGYLKGCLFDRDLVVDILGPLRDGADTKLLEDLFIKIIENRRPYWTGVDEGEGT